MMKILRLVMHEQLGDPSPLLDRCKRNVCCFLLRAKSIAAVLILPNVHHLTSQKISYCDDSRIARTDPSHHRPCKITHAALHLIYLLQRGLTLLIPAILIGSLGYEYANRVRVRTAGRNVERPPTNTVELLHAHPVIADEEIE